MANKVTTKMILENNLELQKVLIGLSEDVKNLTSELSTLVSLFKEASKTLNEEKISKDLEKEEIKNVGSKVETLVDQNKTIAKGLLLMESAMRENLEKRRDHSF